jgi:iron complex transport system substrate-binding protein
MTLSGALAAAIFIVALFPPMVRTPTVLPHIFPAKRAVMLDNSLSGYVTINEGTDHIVAVSKFSREWATDGLLNRIYPDLEHIPLTGNSAFPDPEQMLYLRADVIFAWRGPADFFKATGLPGLVELWIDDSNPIQSRENVWREMGKAAGKDARVTALLERWAAKRAALKTALPQDAARHVRAAWVHVYDGEWYTTSGDGFIAYKLELAGARNVMKRFKFGGKADLEQLLIADPDVVLLGINPDDHTPTSQIADRPELRSLRAVRDHRIYRLPLHTYMNEPVEDLLLLTWMAEVFYPDIMPRTVREEYREVYREVYCYPIGGDEIDRAIYLGENRCSAGYDRFVRKESGT